MKKKPVSISMGLWYAFTSKALSAFLLIIFVIVLIPLISVVHEVKSALLPILSLVVIFSYLFFALVTTRHIFSRMAEDDSLSFWKAAVNTWYGYKLNLSFLPFIGPLFQKTPKDEDVDSETED